MEVTLLTLCKLLEKYNVQYILVGGTAVALNGYYRHSINVSGELTDKPDIDIWYNPLMKLLQHFENNRRVGAGYFRVRE